MPDSSNVITEIKISELPAASQANATDQLEANQSGTTRRITLDQVTTHVVDGAGFAVWDSGALRTLKERATDTYCILDAPGSPDPTGANASTTALLDMAASGVRCEITPGNFVCTAQLNINNGVEWFGHGAGDYMFNGRSKLIFAGTGTKSNTLTPGTWTSPISVANPAAGAAYLADSGTRGNTYTMLDLSAAFSAAVRIGRRTTLRNLGIYPNLNGVAGYSDSASFALSDDWDVGVWAANGDSAVLDRCAVIGHWRKAGLLLTTSNVGDGLTPSGQYFDAYRSYFQGFRGVAIRSSNTAASSWGIANTSFIGCEMRGFAHQSAHLATSSMLAAPFASPSAALELGGVTSGGAGLRGVKFVNSTLVTREDAMGIFGNASEVLFLGCYMEGQNAKVSNVWLTDGEGSRLVATSTTTGIRFRGHAKFAIDHAPGQGRDSSLATSRYTGFATGVFSPSITYDDDYEPKSLTLQGPRLRSASDKFVVRSLAGSDVLAVNNSGHVTSSLCYSVITASVNDDSVLSVPTPKTGGFCAITFNGGAVEDGGFAQANRSGIVFYDTGPASFSCDKFAGGANFLAVSTDVTGTTGVDGNVTIGVISGNLRFENRQGAPSVFRCFFFG